MGVSTDRSLSLSVSGVEGLGASINGAIEGVIAVVEAKVFRIFHQISFYVTYLVYVFVCIVT